MNTITPEERKNILLEIMDEINRFCNDNGLKYYLAYGSLIGAVRHKGFIPWDDDIDIVMFRSDYEKFLKLFNNQESDRYIVKSIHNERKFDLAFAKVCDMRTKIVDDGNDPADIGVNVDIFPIDYATSDYSKAAKLLHKVKIFKLIAKARCSKNRSDRKLIEKIVIKAAKLFSKERMLIRVDKMIQVHKDLTDSVYCANMTTLPYGDREIIKTEWFKERIKLDFENRSYYAPKNYDDILSHIYGDYMKLPSKEKQIPHANIAFWR